MIVCTLCSCYPGKCSACRRSGTRPAPYRSRAVKDPRGVLADFGIALPKDTEIRVWDSTAETRFSCCRCARRERRLERGRNSPSW
jgi:nitrile hydratase